MKKSLRLSAAVALAATASLTLASCGFGGGSDGGDAGGSTTLDLLVPSYSDNTQGLWEDVIAGFEDENPDISVNLEVQSWDNLESVIATKIQGGEAPDIYNGGPFAGFAADELLYPAEEVVSAETFSDFQESFLANAEVDGTAYALPLIASARALFVNNALLEQAGVAAPPTDWDELLDAATKVSALGGGVAGYGMPLGSEEAQAEAAVWLWGGGGTFGDADGDHGRRPGEPARRRPDQEDDRRGRHPGRPGLDRPLAAHGHLHPGQDRHAGRPPADRRPDRRGQPRPRLLDRADPDPGRQPA